MKIPQKWNQNFDSSGIFRESIAETRDLCGPTTIPLFWAIRLMGLTVSKG